MPRAWIGVGMADAFRSKSDGDRPVTFDLPDKKVNTLGQAVLAELARGSSRPLAAEPDLRGLLLRSGKPGQFIAGADLNELAMLAFAPKEQVAQAFDGGHELFNSVSRAAVPDGRADRRQLHGRRDRADPVDGRADRLDDASTRRSRCPRSRSASSPPGAARSACRG